MARSTDAQKAERLNAAHRLLARGQSVREAALSMSRQFAMSRRQAYRYIEEAQLIGRPVPVVEAATAVTFKLPPSLVDAVRVRAARRSTFVRLCVSELPRASGAILNCLNDFRLAHRRPARLRSPIGARADRESCWRTRNQFTRSHRLQP